MWRRFNDIMRRWKARRIEARNDLEIYRTVERNREALENGQKLPEVEMDVIRRCGGFREYANKHVMGPIL